MIGSHGTNHSRGVMILFKPKLDVNIEQIICDKGVTAEYPAIGKLLLLK